MAVTTDIAPPRRPAISLAAIASRYYGAFVSTVSVVAFILLWEIAASRGWINARFTSQPSDVYRAAVEIFRTKAFYYHAWVSLSEFLIGFAAALVVSIPLGLVLGTSRRLRLYIEPPLMALYTAPRLALLPILIVWLGIGMMSKVAIVFLGAVFPIIVNTIAGVREADQRLIQAARAFGASQTDIFIKVLIPGALPAILLGVRLGIGRGLLSVIVGEMFVSEAGIGYQLMTYGQGMHINNLLVYAFVVSFFGYALTVAVRLMEDHIRSWRPGQ
jgi:NitT/TauT family transport system permease protein